jgi:hypothetical protein
MTRSGALRPVLLAALVAVSAVAPLAGMAVGGSENPEFVDIINPGRQNETIGVPVSVPEGVDAVRVTVGTDNENFTAHAYLADADGNGTVVLRVDTATAGNGDASSYFSVSNGDALRNATQETPAIDPPLPPADYAMSLGPPGDPVDVATLIVEGPRDDQPNNVTDGTATTRPTTTVSVEGTTLVYQGDVLELEAAPGQTVHGETRLDAGTEVTVRLRSTGEEPFLETAEATVTEYGTFEATFDLSDVSPGTGFEASVRGDGRRLAVVPGRVECEGDCQTTTERDRAATGDLPADEIAVASHVEVTQTHTAEIPVSLGDADAVTVVVGGDSVNYEARGVVRDRDGDSRVVVEFHTDRAGFEASTLSAYDAGDPMVVENQSESSLPRLLAAGDYPVRVYRGTSADGDPDAEGTLVVYEAPSAVGSTTTTTTAARPTVTDGGNDTRGNDGVLADSSVAGVGAIALGGVLAVAGVGVVLGLFRS